MSITDKRLDGLKAGTVVQLSPTLPAFGGCFMTVTEPKPWGAQGYVQVPGRGPAYYRATWDEMVFIGQAEFVQARALEEETR